MIAGTRIGAGKKKLAELSSGSIIRMFKYDDRTIGNQIYHSRTQHSDRQPNSQVSGYSGNSEYKNSGLVLHLMALIRFIQTGREAIDLSQSILHTPSLLRCVWTFVVHVGEVGEASRP